MIVVRVGRRRSTRSVVGLHVKRDRNEISNFINILIKINFSL
jgi:hypothetical protein